MTSKVLVLLSFTLPAFSQSVQLVGPISNNDPAVTQALKMVRTVGFHDEMAKAKQSFAVWVNGAVLGTFVSAGGRSSAAPYQCLQIFLPSSKGTKPSVVKTAGAGKLGASICDLPKAVGILPSPPDRIRIGILYADSVYLDSTENSGAEAPPVSAAVAIDPKTRIMTLDLNATEILQRAEPSSLPAMRRLF